MLRISSCPLHENTTWRSFSAGFCGGLISVKVALDIASKLSSLKLLDQTLPTSSRVKGNLRTFRPTTTSVPSGFQTSLMASPPSLTSLMLALLLTSQNRSTPSAPQLASSVSDRGLNATFSTTPVWPRNSVEFFRAGLSGFL